MKNLTEVNDPKLFRRFLNRARITLLFLFLMLSGMSFNAIAAEKAATKELTEERAVAIKNRVEEIRNMNFARMSHSERKDVRNELKDMKNELRQHPTGIYISGAALILIIILLILLL